MEKPLESTATTEAVTDIADSRDAGVSKVDSKSNAGADEECEEDGGVRKVKRKMALVIGFVGLAYRGLQISYQIEATAVKRSVEAVVRDAMVRAGMLLESNAEQLEQKANWSRSSRTDAGVSALRLVLASKLLVPEADLDEAGRAPSLVDALNAELPADIRCFSATKVPKSFDAKRSCSWREYNYYLPTSMARRPAEPSEAAEDVAARLRAVLRRFEGCHSFHNFNRLKAASLAWNRQGTEPENAAGADDEDYGDGCTDGGDNGEVGGGRGRLDRAASKGAGKGCGKGKGGSRRDRKRKAATQRPDTEEFEVAAHPAVASTAPAAANDTSQVAAHPAVASTAPAAANDTSQVAAHPAVASTAPAAANDTSQVAAHPAVASTAPAAANDTSQVSAPSTSVAMQAGFTMEICREDPATGMLKERAESVVVHAQGTMYMCAVDVARDGALLRIKLRGQFFLYNQIRLMVGTAAAIANGTLPEEYLDFALELRQEFHMPLAPATGLVLVTGGFSMMDQRAGTCAMDCAQAREVLLPKGGIVLMGEAGMKAVDAFQATVEEAVEKRWAETGEASEWVSRIARLELPTPPRLESLRGLLVAAVAARDAAVGERAEAEARRRLAALSNAFAGSHTGIMPRRFAADLMVRFGLLPGWRVDYVQRALAGRMRTWLDDPGRRPSGCSMPPQSQELLDYVASVGLDVLVLEGSDR